MTRPEKRLVSDLLPDFLSRHRLPTAFHETAEQYYLPLAARLPSFRAGIEPLLLGINGAQGTGKSTLADFLEMAAAELFGWRSAVLSIDDFYLTRAERQALARAVHPLFEVRGAPGTHDTAMLRDMLDQLRSLPAGKSLRLPRFDKSIDDRPPETAWPSVTGPLDLVILEGWCVGSKAQEAEALLEAVNELERQEDQDATWRSYANEALSLRYEPVFAGLDVLVFIAAPSFEAVYRWRLEQERKLAEASAGSAIMNADELARFIRFYERLTRHNLRTLPQDADVVFTLDENHAVIADRYRAD